MSMDSLLYKNVKPLLFSSHLVQTVQVTFYTPYHTHIPHTMQIYALLQSALSAGTLAEVSNSSSQVMQSTETAALLWKGPHSSALPGPTGFQTTYRAVNVSVAQPPVGVASMLQSMDDCETHPCQKFGKQLACRTECM
jgi:hypothetical protein